MPRDLSDALTEKARSECCDSPVRIEGDSYVCTACNQPCCAHVSLAAYQGIPAELKQAQDPYASLSGVIDTGSISTVSCPHCGAANTRLGFDAIFATVCRQCGQGFEVTTPIQ